MIAFSNSLRKTSRRTRTERSASWKTSDGALVVSLRRSQHLVEPLQVADLAHEVGFFGPVGGGADDQPARPFVGAVDHLAQAVALGVGEAAADADAAALRREDQVAAGDRDVHREPRALRLQRVLDHLDEDLLPGFDQLVDPAAAAAAALGRLLAAREDDLVDVEEAVALEADVDEGGLHAGQDVVDLALVDVADDRAPAAALDVELGDVGLAAFRLRLEDGDAGLSALGGDQNRFFHLLQLSSVGYAPPGPSTRASPGEPSPLTETRLDVDALKNSDRQEGSEHGGSSVAHQR